MASTDTALDHAIAQHCAEHDVSLVGWVVLVATLDRSVTPPRRVVSTIAPRQFTSQGFADALIESAASRLTAPNLPDRHVE